MSKFRIEYRQSGVQYEFEYRKSFKGALNCAARKGWYTSGVSHDMRPVSATVSIGYEYYGKLRRWEPIATVTKDGVVMEAFAKRPSIKALTAKLEAVSAELLEATKQWQEMKGVCDGWKPPSE